MRRKRNHFTICFLTKQLQRQTRVHFYSILLDRLLLLLLDHNREKRAETNNKRTSYTEHFQVPETLQTLLDATEKLRITVECTIAVDHSHSSRSGPFIDRAGYGRLAAALPPRSIAIFVFLFPVFPRRAFTFAHTPRSFVFFSLVKSHHSAQRVLFPR